jgi:hypothetical protein
MSPKVSICIKGKVTLRTDKRFFTSVNSNMHLKTVWVREGLGTMRTDERLFTSVDSDMNQ